MENPTRDSSETLDIQWGDIFAIALQELRSQGKIQDTHPLLRIDCQDEAAQAPFQYDPVYDRIHRLECTAISVESRSALFALWNMTSEERALACPHCRPRPLPKRIEAQDATLDIFFGVISILDQFGTVLRERGKEYRISKEGQELERKLEDLYKNLDLQQKHTLDVVLQSMDQMVKFLKEADTSLKERLPNEPMNGKFHTNGAHVKRNGKGLQSRNGKRAKYTEELKKQKTIRIIMKPLAKSQTSLKKRRIVLHDSFFFYQRW